MNEAQIRRHKALVRAFLKNTLIMKHYKAQRRILEKRKANRGIWKYPRIDITFMAMQCLFRNAGVPSNQRYSSAHTLLLLNELFPNEVSQEKYGQIIHSQMTSRELTYKKAGIALTPPIHGPCRPGESLPLILKPLIAC